MSVNRPAAVIVLAAGEGTRMKSKTPKVLHELCGRSMLGHVLAGVRALDPARLLVVVGHGRDAVRAHLAEAEPAVQPPAEAIVQDPQNGTGHAVRTALEAVGTLPGLVVVTLSDTPLLRPETLVDLVDAHRDGGHAATVLSAHVPDPTGYGRVVRDAAGAVAGIVEHRDASPEQRAITEINSGVYAFDGALLADAVKRVSTDNAKGEEYLTDVVAILRDDGHRVGAAVAPDWVEIQGVNDRIQLAEARALLNERLLRGWMEQGVTVVDPRTTWVDADVTLEQDTVIEPQTQLQGRTSVAAGARVGPGCVLRDTTVGAGATVIHAVCERAEIGPEATVGPYTYLRPGSRLGRRARVGSYVEMKNAAVGEGSKVPHLSYVGDADIGRGSNIGAATIFVNYDGINKHHTTVGDNVRIGSDNMLVAPVEIGDGAYTGAGTVVRRSVPPGALAVSGGPQRNIEGWVERRRSGTPSAESARHARGEDTEGTGDEQTKDPSE
ncbi:MAG: bifunctional UDP-N-acetylglucosamine diphosphorylase/glucosamine-1-phosphate N-acetyltransferase GlmU [Streptosporangiales bacterium]|nr:bifunctional UDP-N-acetylglucosamine diphosphorylase/glucosamine-1-phosphate N-acetyltransferase GlmU [Streptosporangiales bacterium]